MSVHARLRESGKNQWWRPRRQVPDLPETTEKINGLNDAEHKGSKSSTQVLRRRGIIGKDTEVKQELAA